MRTLSGMRGGLWTLTSHARERIERRFHISHPAEQTLWIIEMLSTAMRVTCTLGGYYTNAPRLVWSCADDVRVISDGNEILTAWRDGVPDEVEGAA